MLTFSFSEEQQLCIYHAWILEILSVATFVPMKTMRFQTVESPIKMKGTVLGPTNPRQGFPSVDVQEGEGVRPDIVSPGMVYTPFDIQFWFLFK